VAEIIQNGATAFRNRTLFCENTINLSYGNLFVVEVPTPVPAKPEFNIHESLPYRYVILLNVMLAYAVTKYR
jgi:hypothetical protein